jgi:hypothetical protein
VSIGVISPRFQTIESSIELAIMDIEPLPFYVKDRVALIGDAVSPQRERRMIRLTRTQAHAAVPYIGVSAAFAIEVSMNPDAAAITHSHR